jgi:hypothetical protein
MGFNSGFKGLIILYTETSNILQSCGMWNRPGVDNFFLVKDVLEPL